MWKRVGRERLRQKSHLFSVDCVCFNKESTNLTVKLRVSSQQRFVIHEVPLVCSTLVSVYPKRSDMGRRDFCVSFWDNLPPSCSFIHCWRPHSFAGMRGTLRIFTQHALLSNAAIAYNSFEVAMLAYVWEFGYITHLKTRNASSDRDKFLCTSLFISFFTIVYH